MLRTVLPTSYSVVAYPPMPGRTVLVHPTLEEVHGVSVVPGTVYPALQARISCECLVYYATGMRYEGEQQSGLENGFYVIGRHPEFEYLRTMPNPGTRV